MRKFLHHDTQTRELRLVYADLWRGNHERTEYRVTDARTNGRVVRNMPDLDGTPVHGTMPNLYIKGMHGHTRYVWPQETSVGPTVKVPCPKAVDARRTCDLCASAG